MNKKEIINSIQVTHTNFWNELKKSDDTVINKSEAEKWSAAQHVKHINQCLAPLNKYLALPKDVIAIKFGKTFDKQPTESEFIENYKNALDKGAKASAQFVPENTTSYTAENLIYEGINLLKETERLLENNWAEEEMDQFICPHPILGGISLRNILLFTRYHAEHHLKAIKELLKYRSNLLIK